MSLLSKLPLPSPLYFPRTTIQSSEISLFNKLVLNSSKTFLSHLHGISPASSPQKLPNNFFGLSLQISPPKFLTSLSEIHHKNHPSYVFLTPYIARQISPSIFSWSSQFSNPRRDLVLCPNLVISRGSRPEASRTSYVILLQ